MTFTYDDTDLDDSTAAGRLNIVRLLLQDTVETSAEFTDEELTFFLLQQADQVYDAAISAARAAVAKYARASTSRTIGDLAVTNARAVAQEWRAFIKNLVVAKQAASPSAGMPLVGNDIDAKPQFALGQHDNPREDTSGYRTPSDWS